MVKTIVTYVRVQASWGSTGAQSGNNEVEMVSPPYDLILDFPLTFIPPTGYAAVEINAELMDSDVPSSRQYAVNARDLIT